MPVKFLNHDFLKYEFLAKNARSQNGQKLRVFWGGSYLSRQIQATIEKT